MLNEFLSHRPCLNLIGNCQTTSTTHAQNGDSIYVLLAKQNPRHAHDAEFRCYLYYLPNNFLTDVLCSTSTKIKTPNVETSGVSKIKATRNTINNSYRLYSVDYKVFVLVYEVCYMYYEHSYNLVPFFHQYLAVDKSNQ